MADEVVPNGSEPAGEPKPAGIGTLNEKPLHAALKNWYGQPGDRFEVRVGGFVIDIVRAVEGDVDLLLEIQTKNLGQMKRKLTTLVETHPVRLIYPVAAEKWIVRLGEDGAVVGRRRSPKRGGPELLFAELVSFPRLMAHPNFTLEVPLACSTSRPRAFSQRPPTFSRSCRRACPTHLRPRSLRARSTDRPGSGAG